ncbi:oxidoreductase [Diplodia corticola]|uniref:Oxidoreductase n=1 Tax=Diplodia corticola TaxID=236234 RepID=A0A1J9RKT6_9PEZI|nr:oxidoreductase [Diplodia corticola]OJD33203.1 oxidoreductase [Diplodia corticola]
MLNFAVIGTGWITDSFIESAHATGAWKLVGVYSRKQETASAFASKHGAPSTYTTLDALAAAADVHAVYIASPNSLHHAQAKRLLAGSSNNNKQHIILEKPSTSTAGEFEELHALARDKGVFVLEANRHLQERNFGVLREALGRLGPVYGASLNYAAYSSRYNAVLAGETPNIFSLAFSGGCLVDLGVYPIAAAVALFGRPGAQSYSPVFVATGADGGGFVRLQYEGFAVDINQSKIYTSAAPSEVYGEKGTLIVNGVTDIDSVVFLDARTKEKTQLAGEKAKLNLQEEAAEFARIIGERDEAAAKKLEEMSRIVLGITTDLRKQNGIVFDVEKN